MSEWAWMFFTMIFVFFWLAGIANVIVVMAKIAFFVFFILFVVHTAVWLAMRTEQQRLPSSLSR